MDKGTPIQTNTENKDGRYAKEAENIDQLLANVLLVFAARGRAIREERAKREALLVSPGGKPDISDKRESRLKESDGGTDL